MSTAPYVAIATALDRVHAWWESKRLEWAMARLVVDQVEAGWVPEPAMVGLAGPSLDAASDQVEESSPAVPGDCWPCEGTGTARQWDPVLGWVDVTCRSCDGTGEAGAA